MAYDKVSIKNKYHLRDGLHQPDDGQEFYVADMPLRETLSEEDWRLGISSTEETGTVLQDMQKKLR